MGEKHCSYQCATKASIDKSHALHLDDNPRFRPWSSPLGDLYSDAAPALTDTRIRRQKISTGVISISPDK
jgi:hypothetical protein